MHIYIYNTLHGLNLSLHAVHGLCARKWMYNQDVEEFYVITDDKTAHKKTDRTKEIEETDMGATWFAHIISIRRCAYGIRYQHI